MRRLSTFMIAITAVLSAAVLAGCSYAPPPPPPSPVSIAKHVNEQAAKVFIAADQLSVDRTYMAELRFKKEELTLDLDKLISNEASAVTQSIPVGVDTYKSWRLDQELSSSGGAANFWLKGEISSYTVRVNKKWVDSAYSYVSSVDHQPHKISAAVYAKALKLEQATGKTNTVSSLNSTVTYVLPTPLTQLKFSTVEPLTRYYVSVEIENQSATLDLDKQIRNALSKNHITLEVTQQVYDGPDNLWDPHVNVGSFIMKGHLGSLRAHIIKRWTQPDPAYVQATTSAGQVMVLPKNSVTTPGPA